MRSRELLLFSEVGSTSTVTTTVAVWTAADLVYFPGTEWFWCEPCQMWSDMPENHDHEAD